MNKEHTIKLNVDVEVEEVEEEPEEDNYPKRVVLGYSKDDDLEIRGKTYTISYVNFYEEHGPYEAEFSIKTECGLNIRGPPGDVARLING